MKLKMMVMAGTFMGAFATQAYANLPEGWETEEKDGVNVVTAYPKASGKTEANYEVLRVGTPNTLAFTRCLNINNTLSDWISNGQSVPFLIKTDGTVYQWYDPISYKAQAFGKSFNDRSIGFLVETPSDEEKTGNADQVENFTNEEVQKKLADQVFVKKQIDAIADIYKEIKINNPSLEIKYANDYYTLKHSDGGLTPGAYGFSRIANMDELREKLSLSSINS